MKTLKTLARLHADNDDDDFAWRSSSCDDEEEDDDDDDVRPHRLPLGQQRAMAASAYCSQKRAERRRLLRRPVQSAPDHIESVLAALTPADALAASTTCGVWRTAFCELCRSRREAPLRLTAAWYAHLATPEAYDAMHRVLARWEGRARSPVSSRART